MNNMNYDCELWLPMACNYEWAWVNASFMSQEICLEFGGGNNE